MTPPAAAPAPAARLDVRLVPAAVVGWLVTAAGIQWQIGGVLAALCALLGVTAGVLYCYAGRLRRPGWRLVSAAVAAASMTGVGFGWAVALRTAAVEHHPISAVVGTTAAVTVTPSESPLPAGARRVMFRATLQRLDDAVASGRVVVFASGVEFGEVMVGQSMAFRAKVARPDRRDLSVAVLTATGTPVRGRPGPVARAAHRVRARFAIVAARALPDEQARMLPALVLGDTSAITAATGRDFRAAGLTHLMAVSGANVTIVCGAVLFSARLVGPRAAAVLAGIALVAFVIVVQPTASVLRAAVMGAIALLGVLSARSRQAVPSLAASVLVLLALAPHLAVDVGFALSVVATAALVLIAPVWTSRLVAHGWPRPLAAAVCVAWAANLVTAPLIAGISGRLSLVSTVANLAVAALVAPITVLGSAAAVLCGWWPAGASLLIRFTGPELWWVCRVARWSGGVPAATVPVPQGVVGVVGVGAAAVLVVVCWRWRWCRRVLAALALCLLAWSATQVLTAWAGVGTA
ncbi:ComEC/Rec2 family competence protein [Mycolicibacter heraklionensis]|uniref:ComEC/Rec2 family competence protein n=1 Tax=Mycolicibacter heraklionensis TaxID=512402 RepID=A0A9X7WJV9_9MYCO|nr:ComEC/Rec2 family competence protein [Mycolicibacter heraklionensis]QZA09212.1 ComEC/Rec2 family competence protein [Mycolicibacter heraklionensis]